MAVLFPVFFFLPLLFSLNQGLVYFSLFYCDTCPALARREAEQSYNHKKRTNYNIAKKKLSSVLEKWKERESERFEEIFRKK